jgi:arsenate reductase
MTDPLPELPDRTAEHVLSATVDELAQRFSGIFSRETVDRQVHESYQALYRTAKVKHHLPLLAGHFAADRLEALAQAHGHTSKPVTEVLFVCMQNAGRSQMAATLLEAAAGGRVHVRSAGSAPAAEIEPAVVTAMAEVGLDLDRSFPKPLTDDVVRAADIVITMGCADACPVHPGKRYLDWELTDPQDQPIDVVRAIRDDISARVNQLLEALGPSTPDQPTREVPR